MKTVSIHLAALSVLLLACSTASAGIRVRVGPVRVGVGLRPPMVRPVRPIYVAPPVIRPPRPIYMAPYPPVVVVRPPRPFYVAPHLVFPHPPLVHPMPHIHPGPIWGHPHPWLP